MNHRQRLGNPVRAAMAGIIAAALVCVILGAAAAGARTAARQAPFHARTLDWLSWLSDDIPGVEVPAADAAALAGEPLSGAAAGRRLNDDAAGAPRERPAPSHITRISLPPPGDPIRA